MLGKPLARYLVENKHMSEDALEELISSSRRLAQGWHLAHVLVAEAIFDDRYLLNNIPIDILFPNVSGSRVLVVEDTTAMRRIMDRIMETAECRVDDAPEGETALQLIRQAIAEGKPYDMVLLDLMMPKLNGTDLLLRLRSFEETREVPVTVVTALSDRDSVLQCAELAVLNYVIKPFTQFELLVHTEEALGKNLERYPLPSECPLRPDKAPNPCDRCEIRTLVDKMNGGDMEPDELLSTGRLLHQVERFCHLLHEAPGSLPS